MPGKHTTATLRALDTLKKLDQELQIRWADDFTDETLWQAHLAFQVRLSLNRFRLFPNSVIYWEGRDILGVFLETTIEYEDPDTGEFITRSAEHSLDHWVRVCSLNATQYDGEDEW